MSKPIHVTPRGRRLKGLDEFETPEFVGRMAHVRRRKALAWWMTVGAAALVGSGLGWLLF
jgi:hypothetical protein